MSRSIGDSVQQRHDRPPNAFDHLIWSVPELEVGIDDLERRLGVRAAIGGRHAKWGTHNALLSLGGHRYLEILANDPKAPDHREPFGLSRRDLPAITHWMAACRLPKAAEVARARGFEAGEVEQFGREKPDGTRIEWRLATRLDLPGDGLVPTLIDWLGAEERVHPARSAPAGLELAGFRGEHPEPERVRPMLDALRIDFAIDRGPVPRLRAAIRRADGVVVDL
ncbi:MAG: VOC family protein [Phycisphaerales bacterium]